MKKSVAVESESVWHNRTVSTVEVTCHQITNDLSLVNKKVFGQSGCSLFQDTIQYLTGKSWHSFQCTEWLSTLIHWVNGSQNI